MPFFRVKPVVVKATRWNHMGDHDSVEYGLATPEGLVTGLDNVAVWQGAHGVTEVFVLFTPQGAAYVNPGDWIVRNQDGSYSVFNPEQFNQLYEFAAE
jgi:hypothetical protein